MCKSGLSTHLDGWFDVLGLRRRKKRRGIQSRKRRTFSVEPLEQRMLLSVLAGTQTVPPAPVWAVLATGWATTMAIITIGGMDRATSLGRMVTMQTWAARQVQ